jgi:hypothetical protein
LKTLLAALLIAALPFAIDQVTPDAALTAQLLRTSGWVGGDGAHSIALDRSTALWLFGDTIFGEVANGVRKARRMVHNSAAFHDRDGFRFFETDHDLLRPDATDEWYWPGDGALVDGRLELFCMRVRKAPGPYGFDFSWFQSDLLTIDNPRDDPTRWRISRRETAPSKDGVLLGAACAVDGHRLCVWGLRADDPHRTLILATRDLSGAEHRPFTWHGAAFRGGAPEMSVTPFRGGWVAVYSPGGFSHDIALRWAPRPEGPWSEPDIVYRAPEPLLVYGARAHPEMSSDDDLVVTYNTNAPDLETLSRDPSSYSPRFIHVRVAARRWGD